MRASICRETSASIDRDSDSGRNEKATRLPTADGFSGYASISWSTVAKAENHVGIGQQEVSTGELHDRLPVSDRGCSR